MHELAGAFLLDSLQQPITGLHVIGTNQESVDAVLAGPTPHIFYIRKIPLRVFMYLLSPPKGSIIPLNIKRDSAKAGSLQTISPCHYQAPLARVL
jgi:hypothetical protein